MIFQSIRPALSAAGPLLLVHVALLVTWDLAARPWLTVALLSAGSVALWWAVGRLRVQPGSQVVGVLLVALLLRLLLLPVPPTLSDDVLRYVWDGRVVAAGSNPYLLAPEDPALASLQGPVWRSLSHRDVPTVYPPLALGLFSIAARLAASVHVLKLLLSAFDLLTCLLLIRLCAAFGLPVARAAWYAWNPLVVLETAGMGHVDALGVALVAATLFALSRSRPRALSAAAAAAGAVLAKLVPIVVLPIWARASRRPWVFAGVVAVLIVAGLGPIALSARGVPPGITRFAISWEFNGPLYEPLWRLSERLDVTARVERRLDAVKIATERHELWNRFYPFNYPQLHAKLVLAAALGLTLIACWRIRDPIDGTGAVFGAILIFSATVYPWYLLWVLPTAALRQRRAWLLLSGLMPLSYLPQFAGVDLMPWIFAAIWVPFFATLALDRRWSTA